MTQDHTEALRWTAAALQSLAVGGLSESSTFTVEGVKKSVKDILDMADAALYQPQQTAGWHSVPQEPTNEMICDGWAAYKRFEGNRPETRICNIYRAMLAAAPANPADQREAKTVPVLAAAMALLVAGGFVRQQKVDEAIQIALNTTGMDEQQEGGDADMFWSEGYDEYPRANIHDIVVEAFGDGREIGDELEITRAVRMPPVTVRIIEDPEHPGEVDYEYADAAMTGGGDTAVDEGMGE